MNYVRYMLEFEAIGESGKTFYLLHAIISNDVIFF